MSASKSREIVRLKRKLGVELLWIYLLSMLKNKTSHAYVLRKEIEQKFGFLPGNVSVYVVLYKLQDRGFVKSKQDGNRSVYNITTKGKNLLKEAKKELQNTLELVG
jgi:DNA-binding PadR family transcriptional regulator